MMRGFHTKWRPTFAWVFIVWFGSLGIVTLLLLLIGVISFEEASGVIIAMIAAGGGITGTYTYKRSVEKLAGKDYDYYPEEESEGSNIPSEFENHEPPEEFQEGN